jgi:hypothetical protein
MEIIRKIKEQFAKDRRKHAKSMEEFTGMPAGVADSIREMAERGLREGKLKISSDSEGRVIVRGKTEKGDFVREYEPESSEGALFLGVKSRIESEK